MDSTARFFLAPSRSGSRYVLAQVCVTFGSHAQLAAHSLELAANRRIDDRVADRDPRAADQLRIDAYRRFDFLAEALFQRRLERAELRIVDRERADDVRPG